MNKQNVTLEEIERQLELAEGSNQTLGNLIFSFFKLVLQIAILPTLLFIIFTFFLGIAHVEQDSMRPNFCEGDYIIYNRMAEEFKLGDVIVAFSPSENRMVLKRVIAGPGDTIKINEQLQIIVNDVVVHESWQTLGTLTQGRTAFGITLGEGEYFVLGDNREVSLDSRDNHFGNIDSENIQGVVVYRFKMSK